MQIIILWIHFFSETDKQQLYQTFLTIAFSFKGPTTVLKGMEEGKWGI